MIDEKKLLKALQGFHEREEEYKSVFDEQGIYYEPQTGLIDEIIKYVQKMPKVGEWIPVSERLPEEEAKEFIKEHLNGIGYLYPCLLTYRSPNTEKINVVRFYYDLYQNWFVNLREEPCEKDRCLAWQPLPEPWEGEDK